MAYGGAGTLFVLVGEVVTPVDLAMAGEYGKGGAKPGKPLFVQISALPPHPRAQGRDPWIAHSREPKVLYG